MSTSGDDGFFSRWSRRKAQARTGEPLSEPAAPAVVPPVSPAPVAAVPAPEPAADAAAAEAPPPPTLEDARQLTPSSDFRRFVARDVPPEVRNAAVKKLFADPHFNVMDGLDIYIDDYSTPSPLSAADMAKMVSARFLKLVDDPEEPPPPATDNTRAPDAAAPEETHDDHADLQLQPDHAPGPEGPGPGTG